MSTRTLPYRAHAVNRKVTLVALGLWAFHTGRGWLVHAIHVALVAEGLSFA